MRLHYKAGAAVLTAATLFAVGGVGSAVAAKLITGDDIAANTITKENLATDSVGKDELKPGLAEPGKTGEQGPAGDTGAKGPAGKTGAQGPAGATGAKGADGAKGANGMTGLEYRTYDYIAGWDNEEEDPTHGPGSGSGYGGAGHGAVATVACSSTDKVAIAGGIQFSSLHGGSMITDGSEALANHWFAVDSFPGRMNWDTFTPRPDRLDGWIVRINTTTVDPDPTDIRLWTICIDGPR